MTSESDGPADNTPPAEPTPVEAGPERRVAEYGRAPQQDASRARPYPPSATDGQPEVYDQAVLRNPYVLAGIAVTGAILLAIVVVVVFGSTGGGASGDDNSKSSGQSDLLSPGTGRGIAARSIASATVREGPGLDYQALGELTRNQDVEVIGRNADSSWFSIYYPPGSNLKGWVPKTALNLSGDEVSAVPLTAVTPLPRPTVIQPTAPPEPTRSPETPTPASTPTPAGGADLMASAVPGTCQLGQRLVISVRNNGPAAQATPRAITVLVQTPDGAQVALVSSVPVALQAGQAIDIDTNYVVNQRVVVVIDPLQVLGDPNPANNRVDCAVVIIPTVPPGFGTPVPFRTPTPIFATPVTPTSPFR